MGNVDQGGLLPVVKCSDCGVDVSIAHIGEHECTPGSENATPPPPPPKDDDNIPSTTRFFRSSTVTRRGRNPPPGRIDPSAANRPFVDSGPDSGSAPSGSQSPFPKPQRSQTTPLLPTPTSPTQSGRSRSKTLGGGSGNSTPNHVTSSSRSPGPRAPVDTERELPPPPPDEDDDEEAERKRRSRANKHRREASIMMSKGSYGISPTSMSRISPGSRSGRNVMDEVPPLPTGPIKSFTPSPYQTTPEPYTFASQEEFEQDRNVGTVPPKGFQNDSGFDGLKFGLPTNPKPKNGHVEDALGHKRQFSRPSHSSRDDSSRHNSGNQPSDIPSYRVEEDFSVSTFARGLGLADPNHANNQSTSSAESDSSPSEAPSGSSFSSRPSEGTTVYDSRSTSGSAKSHSYKQNGSFDLDLRPPPRNQYAHEVDSPTDPFFHTNGTNQQQPRGDPDLKIDSDQPPVPPIPTEPKSPGQRTPLSRTPSTRSTKSTTRSRCRACGEMITGKSVSSADGSLTGKYHKACFACHVCNSAFPNGDFYILNNNPYCAEHYHQLNGTLCSGCRVGIEGECRQTETPVAENEKPVLQRFHPDCFKCRTCRIVLRDDYFDWEGEVYCERCGRRAALASQQNMMPPPPPSSPYGRRPPPPHYGGPPPPRGGPPRGRGGDPRRRPGGPPPRGAPHLAPPGGRPPPRMGSPGPRPGPRFPERRKTKMLMI